MEISVKERVKDIKTIKEYSVSMSELENLGLDQDFCFRYIEEHLKEPYIMYEYTEGKWSKNPQKKLLKNLNMTHELLNDILIEFVGVGAVVNEKIRCFSVDDFSQNDEEE